MVYQVLYPELITALVDSAPKSAVIANYFLDVADFYGITSAAAVNAVGNSAQAALEVTAAATTVSKRKATTEGGTTCATKKQKPGLSDSDPTNVSAITLDVIERVAAVQRDELEYIINTQAEEKQAAFLASKAAATTKNYGGHMNKNEACLVPQMPERPRQTDCVPLSVLRALAATRGQSLRSLLQEIAAGSFTASSSAQAGSAASSSSPRSGALRLAVAPTILPPNPDRIAMRARIKKIEKAVANEEYNKRVPAQSRVAVEAKLGGRGSGRHRQLSASPTGPENMSSFARDISIGLDMRLMSAAGCVVGYYVCWARGCSREVCLVGAAAGAVLMLLMDAVLLIVRLAKDDGHGKLPSAALQPEMTEKMVAEAKIVDEKARKILAKETSKLVPKPSVGKKSAAVPQASSSATTNKKSS